MLVQQHYKVNLSRKHKNLFMLVFHFKAFMSVLVFVVFYRMSAIFFKESRRASVRMAMYMNMLWSRVDNNRCRMNNYWSGFYYH